MQTIVARADHADSLLNSQTRELKIYWSSLGRTILARFEFVICLGVDIRRATGQILSMLLSITNVLKEMHSLWMSMQRPSEQHFMLGDATGRQVKIYMTNIPDWESVEYFLRQTFKGRKGARWVRRRHYTLQERSSRVEVDRTIDMEHLFSSRQQVDVSLFCRESPTAGTSASCPWCKIVSPSTTETEVQW